MPDQEQRHEMHADATRVSQAHPSEVGPNGVHGGRCACLYSGICWLPTWSQTWARFMQGVGAAWLMVSQGAGPLLVALTQTASAFPFFLLALPAGALGTSLIGGN